MAKVTPIKGRFPAGVTFPGTGKTRWGTGKSFAERQADAYWVAMGRRHVNFPDGSLGALQFNYRSKGNRAEREAAVMALAQVKVNYHQEVIAA